MGGSNGPASAGAPLEGADMDHTISPLGPAVVGVQTAPRPTAAPARVQFSEVLAGGARALVRGAQAALRTLPGSPLMAVAIRGGATGISTTAAIDGSFPLAGHGVAPSIAGTPEGP